MSWSKAKEVFGLLAIVLSLAFGPEDNRLLLFHSDSGTAYGQLELYRDSVSRIFIAKNVSNQLASLSWCSQGMVRFKSTQRPQFFISADTNIVYPRSFALMSVNRRAYDSLPPLVQFREYLPKEPNSLMIYTSSESQMNYIYVILGLLLTVILTTVIITWSHAATKPLTSHKA